MALHLTPAMLEASYELLRTTPPFRGWKLPHADDIQFVVSARTGSTQGVYYWFKEQHILEINGRLVGSLEMLTRIMTHEMCHLRQQILGAPDRGEHGAMFQKLADQVCKWHPLDRRNF